LHDYLDSSDSPQFKGGWKGGCAAVCLVSRWAYLDRLLCVWPHVVRGDDPLPRWPEGGLLDGLGRLPGVTNSVHRLAP
jgi:hypothetical protein